MHTIGRLLCLLAALCAVNAHLFVGQGLAWVTMIHDRAPDLGFQEAVADTFSGENPCPRCCAIAEEREKQEEEAPIPETRAVAKFAPVVHGEVQSRLHPNRTAELPGLEPGRLASQFSGDPKSPPPRA